MVLYNKKLKIFYNNIPKSTGKRQKLLPFISLFKSYMISK